MALFHIALIVVACLTLISFIYTARSRISSERSYRKHWSDLADRLGDSSVFVKNGDPDGSGELINSDVKYIFTLEFETKGSTVDPMIFCFVYNTENSTYPQEIIDYQYCQSDDEAVTWEGGWSLSLDFPRVSKKVNRLKIISMLAILKDSETPHFNQLKRLFLVVSRSDSGKVVFVYDALSSTNQEDGLILLEFFRCSNGWVVKDICSPLSRNNFHEMVCAE